jgi:AP-1 complex subunit beta-1
VVKLFLKKPDEAQGLVQKVLQAATVENDNPDIRDRAYVYWRLLSSDPQVAKNIVLSARPQITSTIPVLPAPLLDNLIPNLSTLSSVYQKLPQAFLGKGQSSALQAAAIEEARQNARENPIAAAAVSAAVSGGSSQQLHNNAENLLDIDFDGAAPASMQKAPMGGASGLEGLAGTPQRVASPGITSPTSASAGGGGMDDLMGMFGNGNAAAMNDVGGSDDLMDGFASLSMNGGQPAPPQHQMDGGGDKKTKEDLLGLF